jgi:hypothetical protein
MRRLVGAVEQVFCIQSSFETLACGQPHRDRVGGEGQIHKLGYD